MASTEHSAPAPDTPARDTGADRTRGENTPLDDDAPGAHIDDTESDEVPEPNEPA